MLRVFSSIFDDENCFTYILQIVREMVLFSRRGVLYETHTIQFAKENETEVRL